MNIAELTGRQEHPQHHGMVMISPESIGECAAMESAAKRVGESVEYSYYTEGTRYVRTYASEIRYRWDGSLWHAVATRRADIDGLVCSGWRRVAPDVNEFVREYLFWADPRISHWTSVFVQNVDLA